MNSEPVLTAATIGAIAAAALTILIEAGVDISGGLANAILNLVAVLAPVLIAAWYARKRVTPIERETPVDRNHDDIRARW